MNPKILLPLAVLVMMNPLLGAGENPRDFPLGKQLVPEGSADGSIRYGEFFVDREIYSGSRPGLADLRVVDSEGDFVPYLIETAGTVTEAEERFYPTLGVETTNTRNDNPAANDRPVTVFQVVTEADTGEMAVNSLEFGMNASSSAVTDWSVEILIEGRTDESPWTTVKKDSLYDLKDTRKTTVLLDGACHYNFWRITVLSGNRSVFPESLTPRWNSLREETRPFAKTIPLKTAARTEKEGMTLLELASPFRLPLSALIVTADGPYSRDCRITGEGLYGSGRILRWEDEAGVIDEGRLTLSGMEPAPEKLFLEIDNGSDKPLTGLTITAEYLPARIVFEMLPDRQYTVLFGNPAAEAPSYDLEAFRDTIAGKPRINLIPGTLEETLVIDTGIKTGGFPWKIVLNLLLVLAGVGLTVLIVVALRRQKGE